MASRFRGCSHSGEKRSGKSAGRERDGSTAFTLFFNTDVSSRHCHTRLHLIFYLRDDALSLQLAALLDFRPRTNGLANGCHPEAAIPELDKLSISGLACPT